MKKLIKEKTDYLADMLAGMKIANDDIDIIADTVVVRKNKKTEGVAIVSGGGSGHEPSHAGYRRYVRCCSMWRDIYFTDTR